MKGSIGVQMQVHPKFLEIIKDIIDDRVKIKKERSGELSYKRLTLTIYKLLKGDVFAYNKIVTANIDLNEV